MLSCRTTGGGDLIPGNVDVSCTSVPTTISPNGNLIVKITHGGQLGAPFDAMDCGEIIGNPCIRGNWSHHRHYGNNLVDAFDVDFHSSTPGVRGVYDSLDCACLGCCQNPGASGDVTKFHHKQICNLDDRRICGPLPAPANANALIFSGIGTIQPAAISTKNPKQTFMVFRVFIVDRSEPGGNKPGGQREPADIYCFQGWDTGITVQRNNSDTSNLGNSPLLGDVNTFRTAVGAANCAFISSLKGAPTGTLPSDTVLGKKASINDCGPLSVGNRQIHESTGAADKCP